MHKKLKISTNTETIHLMYVKKVVKLKYFLTKTICQTYNIYNLWIIC